MRAAMLLFVIAFLLVADGVDCSNDVDLQKERTLAESTVPTISPAPNIVPSESPAPSPSPSASPSFVPSISRAPSSTPSNSVVPSRAPSSQPSLRGSASPTDSPAPSPSPTSTPSAMPSPSPTSIPSAIPSASPSAKPSATPTSIPSAIPSASPSVEPSAIPTSVPSAIPSASPSAEPSASPTRVPSRIPSALPSDSPSSLPSASLVPTSKPSVSHAPSSMPSSSPTTAFVGMTDAFTVHLPDTDEEVDLEVFESAVHVFVSENIAPNSTFIIIIIIVEVTSQELVTMENVTSFVDIYFNITGNVGPRPVPWDFDFPYHVGYGFENNLTGFLGTLEEEKEKAEQGPPVVGVSDSEVEVRSKENKLDTVAIIFIALLLLFLLLLLLCLCWRCCCLGKDKTQDEDVIDPTESDEMVEAEEEAEDDDDYTEISEKPSELGWPPKASNLHKYPFSNVHDCKSAYCPTCVNKANEEETGFVDVTESKSFGARLAAAFSPRSFSLRSRSTWSTPKSTGRSTDDDVSR